MTREGLEAAEARLMTATPGPWGLGWARRCNIHEAAGRHIGSFVSTYLPSAVDAFNAEFAANAPADIAALLAYVRTLEGLVSDRVQDSDLAVEAVRRERERCVAIVRLALAPGGAAVVEAIEGGLPPHPPAC